MNSQITLESLIKLLRKNFRILLGWVVGCFIVTALFTFLVIEPTYEATSRIVVNQRENRGSTITSTDINTNISLINTYQSIIMEPIILEDVIEQTESNASMTELREKISFETEEGSLVFGIAVTDEDPYDAANVANAAAQVFQNKIGEILPVESVTILSKAMPNPNPVSPNILLNLAFGIFIGFFVGFFHILLADLLDKRVKSQEIITDLGWLNLGSVNKMTEREIYETALPNPKKEKNLMVEESDRRERIEGEIIKFPLITTTLFKGETVCSVEKKEN